MSRWQKIVDLIIDSTDTAGDYCCKQTLQTLLKKGLIQENEKFNIDLVLRESINNAILHGNRTDIRKKVILKVFHNSHYIKITIQDQGLGFDWHSREIVELSDSETHGRGLFIIKLYSDKYYYNSKGNKLTLFKKIGEVYDG